MTKLRLSTDLALPLESITETIAILGIRGSGKTNTAAVYAEELLRAGQQVVIVDPTDAWWGLKSSADGQSAGFPVVVLGGKHADLPLNATDGKLVADFVVEQGASVICSLRGFESKQQELAFVTAFLRRLYHLKGQQTAPTPVALFIDEASRMVPQRVMGEDAACVGAVQQIVRQGRSSGFGIVLIDQRAATVNKDVLAQLEMMVVHRTTGPQDRKALQEWIVAHDTAGREKEFLASLASLAQGEAWFWSPGWLDLFKKVQVRQRKTFDSSRTPRAGEVAITPKEIAQVDLDTLRTKLAATIEKAKADDPKELRKEIAALKKQLRGDLRKAQSGSVERIVDRPVVDERAIARALDAQAAAISKRFVASLRHGQRSLARLNGIVAEIQAIVPGFASMELALQTPVAVDPAFVPPASARPTVARTPSVAAPRQVSDSDSGVSTPQQRMLDSLASFEAIGVEQLAKSHVAVYSNQSSRSSGFRANLSALSAKGLIERVDSETVRLTEDGRALASAAAAPATLDELHDAWLAKVSTPQRLMLSLLIEAATAGIDKEDLARQSGQSPLSSGYRANLSTLSALGLVKRESGMIVVTDVLFPEGLS